MAYKALYRTYRPTTFEAVAGQNHVITTLQNALKQNKLAHAYLFCGPRGTGKTSIAKLLAKAVNCTSESEMICNECDNCVGTNNGTHSDVIEIDAASNNGVDEIRDLIEKVKYAPIQGKYKVYIIDEVHMLSLGAFNALLKTLEEPPEHVIFILATTEPHKVIPTIISRCQRFDFTKVKSNDIKERIESILKEEKIDYEEEALDLVCDLADGGVRDALSILDQCISYSNGKITLNDVNEIYGIITQKEKEDLLQKIFSKEAKGLLIDVNHYSEKGMDIKRLTADLIEILKEVVIYEYTKDEKMLVKITPSYAEGVLSQSNISRLLSMIDILVDTTNQYRNATSISSYFELCLLKLMNDTEEVRSEIKEELPRKQEEEKSILVEKQLKVEENIQKENIVVNDQVEETPTVIEEEQKEPEKVIPNELPKSLELDDEYILGLLVGASKERRTILNEKWKYISNYLHDIEYAALAQKLVDSQLVAVGNGYILVSVAYQALANDINDQENREKYELFIDLLFNEVVDVIAVENEEFKRIVNLFIQRGKESTLPEAIAIKKEKKVNEVKQEDGITKKMEDLFGPGMFNMEE